MADGGPVTAGRTIADRYDLVEELGEGGMGVVWRARDTRLGRTVAVKLLPAASLGSDLARKRLVREARAAAALEHDGIVRVYDVGETDDGGAYLVMELVRGRSLRSELAAGDVSLSRATSITIQAARALHVAHQAGIIHRDVKPDNIMIRETGTVIVVDFGVAKPVEPAIVATAETVPGVTGTVLTGAGQLVGTPAYLSPEQARGVDVTPASDQFALAVTAYEAMTGRSPWKGNGVVDVVAAILRDDPEPLGALVPSAPAALESALARALAKEPADRWPDLEAFAGALEEAALGLPSDPTLLPERRPRRSGTDYERGTATPKGTAVTQPALTPPPPARSRRGALVGAGLACALATSGYYVMHARDTSAPPASTSPQASAVVACPPFEVAGMDGTWLGFAAATLACERVAFAHGGSDGATVTPAELVGAPRDLAARVLPSYEEPSARAAAVEAAKRSERWIDGRVERQVNGYLAQVTLRTRDGAEVARGEGRGVELFEAIRDAMKPSLGAPTKDELATLLEWLDVGTVDAALALLDVRTAVLIEDPVSLKAVCVEIDRRTDLSPRAAYLARSMCAKKLRTGALAAPPPPVDDSTLGALITSALAQGASGGPAAVRERAARLEQARDRTSSLEGKSRLSAAAAELYNFIGDERARSLSRAAIQFTPKAVDWRTSAWHRVAFSSDADSSLADAVAVWQPWEPVAQSLHVPRGQVADTAARARFTERAYLLSRRGYYAYAHGSEVLMQGRIEEARGIAELTQDDLLRVDILLAEARYGEVLRKAPALLAALPASDETASLAFRLAHDAMRASMTLDRPADFMDGLVMRWVEAEPHHVIDGVVPFVSLVSACCLAPRSVGKRCVDRLQNLRADAKLPTIFNGADTVLAGAARFVVDDYAGAAKSWRTQLRTPGWIQEPLRAPMSIAFDRADEPDLADEIDAPTLALVDLPRPADSAWVRAARRAHKRGDTAAARKFAQAVVDKWRFADEDVPATREMKALLAKLPK